ncbi:MAG: alkaline phosphatase [Bacteroidales bacterium]|jgi:alkaline phosphatase|nr:alkaline phosphatase [Bacteroidales bacterium]
MKKTNLIIVLALVLIISSCGFDKSSKVSNEFENNEINNVILLIGDGMGVSQVYAGMTAAIDTLNIESLKNIGFSKTYSINNYITDSGAGGTALSTGSKTKNGFIAVDSSKKKLKTILEYAEENNHATGLVSTSSIVHATPASFISHYYDRNDYEKLALDFIKTDIDIFIGGGRKSFAERKDSLNLIDSLTAKKYDAFYNLDNVVTKDNNIAVFTAEGHNPKYSEGRGDMLPNATETAINFLKNRKDGFFLMVEGSQIDWGGHDNDTEYIVAEMIDFDKAIGKAIDFAKLDGHTLVIVTADHECGGLALNGGNINKGIVEGAFTTDYHTAVMVPVFAYGPGANEFMGIYENTAIFDKMMNAFNFSKE